MTTPSRGRGRGTFQPRNLKKTKQKSNSLSRSPRKPQPPKANTLRVDTTQARKKKQYQSQQHSLMSHYNATVPPQLERRDQQNDADFYDFQSQNQQQQSFLNADHQYQLQQHHLNQLQQQNQYPHQQQHVSQPQQQNEFQQHHNHKTSYAQTQNQHQQLHEKQTALDHQQQHQQTITTALSMRDKHEADDVDDDDDDVEVVSANDEKHGTDDDTRGAENQEAIAARRYSLCKYFVNFEGKRVGISSMLSRGGEFRPIEAKVSELNKEAMLAMFSQQCSTACGVDNKSGCYSSNGYYVSSRLNNINWPKCGQNWLAYRHAEETAFLRRHFASVLFMEEPEHIIILAGSLVPRNIPRSERAAAYSKLSRYLIYCGFAMIPITKLQFVDIPAEPTLPEAEVGTWRGNLGFRIADCDCDVEGIIAAPKSSVIAAVEEKNEEALKAAANSEKDAAAKAASKDAAAEAVIIDGDKERNKQYAGAVESSEEDRGKDDNNDAEDVDGDAQV